MSSVTSNNRYPFPSGYRGYVAFSNGAYTPWNGYNNGANAPNNIYLGPVLQFVSSGVPTDKQIMQISGPDGKQYYFQFLYNATVGDDDASIEVRLPNSGASTAAQVMTALLAVLSLSESDTEGGDTVVFPWVAQSINATTSRINWTVNGSIDGYTAPTGIAITINASATPGYIGISNSRSVCAMAGSRGAFLPGP